MSYEEGILAGKFLCSNWHRNNEEIQTDQNYETRLPILEKILITDIFPWKEELSSSIDHDEFCNSFLVQPDSFLRVRPGMNEIVVRKLSAAGIQFSIITNECIAFPNATKIEDVFELDKEAVIQDYSSQRTGEYIQSAICNLQSPISLWDCCAGSGGKSIMSYDINTEIELIVSDIRESILANLKKRFQKAGIKNYKCLFADLANEKSKILNLKPEIIIADVPCTGSGTWSRTPEQLYFFDKKKIDQYVFLQKKILTNTIPHLLPGGILVYITCSVFKKENEENVEFLKSKFNLQLEKMELLKGYDKKADSMFVAVLRLPE